MEKSDHKLNRIISDWIFPIFISPLYKESCQLYIFKLLQTMIKDFANRKLSIWTTLAQTTWTYFWSCTHIYEENNCLCDSLHDFKKNKMCSKSKYKHLLDVAKSFWCRCCFIFDKFITFFFFVLKVQSLFEILYGKYDSLKHLCIFGCLYFTKNLTIIKQMAP